MLRPLATALAALVLLSASALARAAGVELRGAALQGETAGGAVLTLELSGEVTPRLFRLEDPDRVVLDLPGTRLTDGLRLPEGAGPIATVRSGVRPGGALRLVFETTSPVTGQARLQGSAREGWRLLVQMRPAAAVAPATPTAPAAPAAPAVPTEEPATAAAQAPPVATPTRSAAAPVRGRDVIVAIDAGHGGQDPGAIGRGGTREKDVVLAIAQALARRIDAEPGMRAVLTRNGDRFIALRERMNLARAARADIFISVHADAIGNRSIAGSSVYVLSERGASSEAARWLAERENAADLKGGVSLSDKQGQLASVLMDLSQTASIGSSMEAAEKVLVRMDRVGEIRKSQVQQANFAVLKSPDIPSMLVETAYISNPAEEKRLRTQAHQQRIAEAIFAGVRDYFRASPPDGTMFAQARGQGGTAPIMAASTAR